MTVLELIEALKHVDGATRVIVPNGEMPGEWVDLREADLTMLFVAPTEWKDEIDMIAAHRDG